jgi:hypothetical protein
VGAVVGDLPERDTCSLQPSDGVGQPSAGGIVERDVMQPGDPVGLRAPPGRLPCVEPR